jgi:Tol biopolymer transport system component
MSVLRRAAIAATAICAVTSTVLVGGGLATAAPTVANGDLLFSESAAVVRQAPRASTSQFVAEGNNAKYSPDGRRIAYTSPSGYIGYGIWVKTLASGTPRQLGDPNLPVGGLAWSPDGGSLVVASGNQLLRVKVSTGAAVPIFTGSNELRDPAWSPDGTRIAFTAGAQIQLVRPSGNGLRTFTVGGNNSHADWSPDGTRIAFITDRYVTSGDGRAYAELVTLPSSGLGEPVRVSHQSFPQGLYYMGVAWSPDGRKIAALQFNATHLPNDEDTDERFKVRGYAPDGSSSYSLTGPIYGDDGPEGLDWAPKVS